MVTGIEEAIEAIGKATEKGFSYAEKAKEKQSETAILKDRKELQKAVNIAEKLILLTYKYFSTYNEKDRKEYKNLVKDFIKYN